MKAAAVVVLLLAAMSSAAGQDTSKGPASTPAADARQVYHTTRARIAIGRSIHVPADEEVSESVVVVAGSARVDGRVRDGVVVVGGNLEFGPRSDVRGEIVVVGGRIVRSPGAQVRGPVTDISLGDWRRWQVAGLSLPVVDLGELGEWLTLFGTFFRVALLALMAAFIVTVARAPVARIGRSAAAEPGRAFALGLAAELLFLPLLIIVCISLVITVIGIPIAIILLPVAVLSGFVALVLGFTALACRVGEWIEDRLGWHAHSAVLAMIIGLLLIVGPTMLARVIGVTPEPFRLPAIGLLTAGLLTEFIVWTIGLGATLMTGFGRWSTVPPPPPAVPQPSILPATN